MNNQQRQKANWEKAVDQGLEICSRIDEDLPDDMPDNGIAYCEDVRASVSGVIQTIERTRHVTEKQQKALDGWERGVAGWMK
jgi:hypothetical protein